MSDLITSFPLAPLGAGPAAGPENVAEVVKAYLVELAADHEPSSPRPAK